MALIHYLSLSELEEILVHEHVEDEMHYFIEQTKINKNLTQLHTRKFIAFKRQVGEKIEEYPFLATLLPGMHEKYFKNHTFTIAVKELSGERYYVLYDETDFEDREEFLLVALSLSIILAILFALWFGYWISGKIISPLARLASQVDQLQTLQLETKLSDEFADDEVRQLAKTFDNFMHKLHLFIERERSFTADASHELRTPLAIIQGAVEVMIDTGNLSDDDTRRLERIERATRDMNQNLTALLVLARQPSGEAVIEGEADLARIIEDVIESCNDLFSSENIKLETNIDRVTVKAPSNIVSVLIGNIIRNAFLYTEEGVISITLEQHKLSVTDTGIGILEKDLSRIFEKGYRGENATGQGSGLGLSLAKRICDYYKWQLIIESSKDEGTTITWHF